MVSLEDLIAPIRHSPRLPEVVTLLQHQMQEERRRRNVFYREMTDEKKSEFVDGEVVLHSPARNRHLDVTLFVAKLLDTYVGVYQCGTVKAEKCLCVFPRNDYEPDVVYFGEEKAAVLTPDTLKFPVPDLAVEVLSDSTEQRDRGVKFEDFAANGVSEYWIVNADESILEQYVLRSDRYDLKLKSQSGRLLCEVIAGFEIDVEALFDEQRNLSAIRQIIA